MIAVTLSLLVRPVVGTRRDGNALAVEPDHHEDQLPSRLLHVRGLLPGNGNASAEIRELAGQPFGSLPVITA